MFKFISEKMIHIVAASAFSLVIAATTTSNTAHAWTLEEAAKPYAGTELRGICDGYAPCLAYIELAKKFQELTDIKINLEVADLEAIQTQFLTDVITEGEYYDFVEVISFSSGVFPAQGFVHPYSDFTENAELRDPSVDMPNDVVPALFKLSSQYEGVQYSVPTKYVLPYMVYRHDLVTEEEQTNFKAKFGYDMPLPPTEWQQVRDMSEFYTRKKGETLAGKVLERNFYGTVVPFKRHLTVLYDFERVLLGMGGAYVNEDGTVAIDQGDVAVQALEFMLSLREYSIPGYMEATWDEQYAEMCNGSVFTIFTWGDTTPFLEIPADCASSAGNMTYYVHPGTHLTPAEGQGWFIPKSAKNAEAAFLFIQWLQTKEIQVESMPMGGNPSRSDVIRMAEWQADDWPNRQREQLEIWLEDNNLLYSRPNPPHWLAWNEIIKEELSAAGAGNQDAATTIQNIAARMREAAGE
ncbi:MAG: extracellular solute-binding protein [Gammaproteobacteria bacterium]|nr:extracellular solute-binding protein [Gammaproteobacteria bacterium]